MFQNEHFSEDAGFNLFHPKNVLNFGKRRNAAKHSSFGLPTIADQRPSHRFYTECTVCLGHEHRKPWCAMPPAHSQFAMPILSNLSLFPQNTKTVQMS